MSVKNEPPAENLPSMNKQCIPPRESESGQPLLGARVTAKFFIAGTCGSALASTLTFPLDIVKTRLQSSLQWNNKATLQSNLPPGAFHIYRTAFLLRETARQEGYLALFRGLGPNLLGFVPASAIKFFVYGNTKAALTEANGGHETPVTHFLAASAAGFVTCTATNPFWVIKTRMQLDKQPAIDLPRRYRNAFDCLVQTCRQEGPFALYKGLGASYIGVGETAVHWMLYEQLKRWPAGSENAPTVDTSYKRGQGLLFGWEAISGATAKSLAVLIFYPHEVLRTRLRQAPTEFNPVRQGIINCARDIVRREGLAAFYGGLAPHLLRAVPSNAIMFATYEAVLRALG